MPPAPPLFLEDDPDELRFEEVPDAPPLVEELRFADERDELLFADEPLADLPLLEREEPPLDALDRLPLAERDEPPPEEAELCLPFDPDDALLPAERDLSLPLDLPAGDVRFTDELRDDDFAPSPDARSPPLIFEANADCTTFAAPSTAPIAALVKSVPATSAALDNRPLDRRLLLLDF